MTVASLSMADFKPFLDPSVLDTPGSPPEIEIHPRRLDALHGVYQWLADLKETNAPADRLAFLVRFHYGGDPFAANTVLMTGWLTARTEEEKRRWSVAHHVLDMNEELQAHNA